MKVTNTTGNPFDFYPSPGFALHDARGRSFETYEDTIGSVDEYLNVRALAPDIPERGVLVYEVPDDASDYYILVGKQGTSEDYRFELKENTQADTDTATESAELE